MDGIGHCHASCSSSSSPPSSPAPFSEDSSTSSSVVVTPEVIVYNSSMTTKGTGALLLHEPSIATTGSPGCEATFNLPVSSPFDRNDQLLPDGHFVQSEPLRRKRSSTPLLACHRTLGSTTTRTNVSTVRAVGNHNNSNRHSSGFDPYSVGADCPTRGRRDSDGMIQKQTPPTIHLGRRLSVGDSIGQSSSRSISTGAPTFITIPSIPEFMRIPSLHSGGGSTVSPPPPPPPSLPVPAVVIIPSKGYIQPHVNNLPRRRRREPKYTEAEIRERRRWDWERRTWLCEAGDGVFVSFCGDDQDTDEFSAEFLCVIIIAAAEEGTKSGSEKEKEKVVDDRTLRLLVPSAAPRDDGLPHLTTCQLRSACEFVRDVWSPFMHGQREGEGVVHDYPKRLLIMTERDRPADAMAVAAIVIASNYVQPILAAGTQGPLPLIGGGGGGLLPLHPISRPASPLRMLNQLQKTNMDDVVVDPSLEQTHSHGHGYGHSHYRGGHPAIHTIVMRLHDMASEDDGHFINSGGLKGPWRGVLSRDGMDFLVGCMGQL